MFTCCKRNDKREVKVAQLAGSVAEMSAYHHGEVGMDKGRWEETVSLYVCTLCTFFFVVKLGNGG